MTRICSLLPSATEIVVELGLVDSLVGVSAECRWPAEVVGKPVVTSTRLDLAGLSGAEIDSTVRDSLRVGLPLYALDAELLEELRPDVIVTQNLCAVCAVPGDDVAAASPVDARIVSLDPYTLADVAASVQLLARELDRVSRGEEIVAAFWTRIDTAARIVRGLARRRVFFAEWIEPPFAAGHWLPEMIELAGGRDPLAAAGRPSRVTTWDAVAASTPELVVVAPCGFDAEGAAAAAADLRLDCPAVAVDADGYYSRPGPRLAEGVAQLAHLFHPAHAPDPGLPAVPLRALV